MILTERQLLRDKTASATDSPVLLRITYVDYTMNRVWLCRLDDNSWPEPVIATYLEEEINDPNGKFEIWPEDPYLLKISIEGGQNTKLQRQKSKDAELQRQRYENIYPLISGENKCQILFPRQRVKLVNERAMQVGFTRQYISKLLLIWLKKGMCFSALRPSFDKCGGAGKKRKRGHLKLGAPRTISLGTGINTTPDVEKHLQLGADLYISKKKTLQKAVDFIVEHFYSAEQFNESKQILEVKPLVDTKPTKRQLYSFIINKYGKEEVRRRRHGQNYWDLNEREILSSASAEVNGPGERFQIDATIADVYLRSQLDRRRIVGRPVIYFAIDVFSSMIVAMYAGFEGPSWIGAMMVLVNMVTPKKAFCAKYGVEISEEEWPSNHLPRTGLADRGELMSVNLGHNIVKNLFQIENTPPRRGDLKGLVERRFGYVPTKFREHTTGWVEQKFPDRKKRAGRDPRLDSIMTLPDFTTLMICAVLEHNSEPIRSKRIPAEMITEGRAPSPLNIWNWGIKNRSGKLRTASIEEVAINVMPTRDVKVTAKGIEFEGACYTAPSAIANNWFAKARQKTWYVTICYDPRDLGVAYLLDDRLPNGYEKCSLLPQYATEYEGKSLYEIQELRFANKRQIAATENESQANRIQRDHVAKKVLKEAKQATRSLDDPTESDARRLANIRDNKKEEKDFNRQSESFNFGDKDDGEIVADSAPVVAADRPQQNALEYLKSLNQQRDGDS